MRHITNFYLPRENFSSEQVRFTEEESAHLIKVLRASVGDEVVVTDGEGGLFLVEITRADAKWAKGEIVSVLEPKAELNVEHILAIGTISPKRLEMAWDACVQLGVSGLMPIWTEYCLERLRAEGKFIERLEAVAIRAMKQSGRVHLPKVSPPQELSQLLTQRFDRILFADIEGLPTPPNTPPRLGGKVLLLVGPEGGFSSEERRLIAESGGVPISLGPRRLRAETAAIALSVVALRWTGDL